MALGDLKDALEDRQHYYAWCIECGFAKPAFERVCCNEGRLPPIRGFRCPACIQITETHIADTQAAEEREAKHVIWEHTVRKAFERLPPAKFIKCPSCGTPIEKVCSCSVQNTVFSYFY
jgi:hypothetical protein